MAPFLDENENEGDEFYDKGYVVLKDVVPKERALKSRNKMMDWLGTFHNDFDIKNPETWTKENLPQSFENNTTELIVSYETINLTLPNASKLAGSKPWPHLDQAPKRQGLSCVQGVFNFSEAGPKDGGLVVMEGSAKLFDKLFKQRPFDQTKGLLTALHYEFYPFQDSDVKW
ncbi:hypothetical protein G6011_08274 [Alternaria panax]|uniref:Uncharacterized protein n=1 Tax=Alternaria panax TaxID=48097 RepID=A0AAD4FKH3_9PLEO|nr:hypothetical protein G6011_08274 [Alternaria panax]